MDGILIKRNRRQRIVRTQAMKPPRRRGQQIQARMLCAGHRRNQMDFIRHPRRFALTCQRKQRLGHDLGRKAGHGHKDFSGHEFERTRVKYQRMMADARSGRPSGKLAVALAMIAGIPPCRPGHHSAPVGRDRRAVSPTLTRDAGFPATGVSRLHPFGALCSSSAPKHLGAAFGAAGSSAASLLSSQPKRYANSPYCQSNINSSTTTASVTPVRLSLLEPTLKEVLLLLLRNARPVWRSHLSKVANP